MKRPTPGSYLDCLPEIKYHNKDHGHSSSDLKSILKNGPEKFKYFYDQPSKEPTDAMKVGSVLHCGLLRPEEFDQEIIQLPDLNLRTNAGKAEKEEFYMDNLDKLIVTQKQLDLGMGMVESCKRNDDIMELLSGSVCERSMYAEILGTPLRTRPDSYKNHVLLELKSTRDASPTEFAKQIANLHYHVSLVHYAQCMEQCAPEELEFAQIEYRFLVVENTEPFVTAVYRPTERMVHVGFELWKEAFALLQSCLENDTWPGHEETEIDLPGWAVPYEEEQ